jgi:hypothetical protein
MTPRFITRPNKQFKVGDEHQTPAGLSKVKTIHFIKGTGLYRVAFENGSVSQVSPKLVSLKLE